jgi:hypothetical protein
LEVEFDSLGEHPLWVDKAQRQDFAAKQVAVS